MRVRLGITRRGLRGSRIGGGGAPAFSGVLDDVVAAGGSAPNWARSISHQLTTAYSGALIRVREAGGGTQADIGFSSATHMLDTAALAAHCGSSDGFVVTVYDQSGNARDVTQATSGNQPKIYDGATGTVLLGTLACSYHDGGAGTSGTGDYWSRSDMSGFSGSPDITIFSAGRFDDITSFDRVAEILGGSNGLQSFTVGAISTNRLVNGTTTIISVGNRVEYTPGSSIAAFHYRIADVPAGQLLNNGSLRQNGAACSVATGVGTNAISALAGNRTVWGASNTSGTLGDRGVTGYLNTSIGWNALLAGAVRTAIETFGASLNTLAGV